MLKSSRARNLGVAAALALVAALLTMLYGSRAQGGTKVAATQTAPVLVASKDLAIGTSLANALATGSVATKQLPSNAVATDALRPGAATGGRIVQQPIYAGEQLTLRRFGAAERQGIRSVLTGSLRAISIQGDARQLLAGTLAAGDHVDVVVNDKLDSMHPKSRVALQNLIVLAAPDTDGVSAPGSADVASATLQLSDRQVQVLWWAVKNADWSLVLRPAAKASVTAKGSTEEAEVLKGVTK
jgi:Flp pilus assembly protein CpaB